MMKLKRSGIKKGLKRFALRRSTNRISRRFTLNNDATRIQVEVYSHLYTVNGVSSLLHYLSSQNYCNIATMMANSTSWSANYGQYSRYKIYGLGVRCNYSMDRTAIAAAYTGGRVPNLAFAFYPSVTSTDLGDNPEYNDHKLYVECNTDRPQTKYYAFRDNFYDGGAYGFGTWGGCAGYASQIGQVSVTVCPNVNATAVIYPAVVKYTLYIILSDKNQ